MNPGSTVAVFLIFLAGITLVTIFVHWYRCQHLRFDLNARVRWYQAFGFERAGYIVVGLSVAVFITKQLFFSALGGLSDLLLGATAGLTAIQYHRYDPDTTTGGNTIYIN